MFSPAATHRLKVQEQRPAPLVQAVAENFALPSALPHHESVLMGQFKADFQQLKHIKSRVRRNQEKQSLLGRYQGWLDSVLQEKTASLVGTQASVFVWLLVWHLDVGEWLRGFELARVALKQGLAAPTDFSRSLAETVCEELVTGILKAELAPNYRLLLIELNALLAGQDMADPVTAKLYKALGLAYQHSEPEVAKAYFVQALERDSEVGVKRYLSALNGQGARRTREPVRDYRQFTLSAHAAAKLAQMTTPRFLRHAKKYPDLLPRLEINLNRRKIYQFNPVHVRAYLQAHLITSSKDHDHVQS
ncbi:phage terminase small subunit [uncultured Thiothrix sp.]|uniref:phage terminase small subunit n=1 Tax=uncultured Thiothrix sp. TaxID=223185 RepID=UPI00260E5F63|nr:phage terminase small subunit [uncultured Thiothrix sp.]